MSGRHREVTIVGGPRDGAVVTTARSSFVVLYYDDNGLRAVACRVQEMEDGTGVALWPGDGEEPER